MKLKISDLTVGFNDQLVLDDINIEFESNKIYALLGRNGAGKTTFFNALADDLTPYSLDAKLVIDDKNHKLTPDDIGYVVSTPNVPDFLTGREFLRFIMEMHNKDGNSIVMDKEIDDYFDYLSIAVSDRDKLMKDYSHGTKSKIQIIVNIITNPKVLFLDEPLTTLDVVMAEKIKNLLREIKKDYIIIFSTHIMELALDLCDEIVLLHDGKLEAIDRVEFEGAQLKNRILELLSDEDE